MIECRQDSFLPVKFYNHLILGLTPNTGHVYEKNILEKAGDVGLWVIEKLPPKVWKAAKEPRVIGLAITVAALFVNSLIFYPSLTARYTVDAAKLLGRVLPLQMKHIRFASWAVVCETIVAAGARFQGRFWNTELKNQFYVPARDPQAVNDAVEVVVVGAEELDG